MNQKPITALDDRILELWPTGMTTLAIAKACRASVLDVQRAVDRGRYRRDPRAAPRRSGRTRAATLSIPAGVAATLEAEARERSLTVDQLAELLLVRAGLDGMVGAILDDGALTKPCRTTRIEAKGGLA